MTKTSRQRLRPFRQLNHCCNLWNLLNPLSVLNSQVIILLACFHRGIHLPHSILWSDEKRAGGKVKGDPHRNTAYENCKRLVGAGGSPYHRGQGNQHEAFGDSGHLRTSQGTASFALQGIVKQTEAKLRLRGVGSGYFEAGKRLFEYLFQDHLNFNLVKLGLNRQDFEIVRFKSYHSSSTGAGFIRFHPWFPYGCVFF